MVYIQAELNLNMRCPKCAERSKEITMKPDIENMRYLCPECNFEIKWGEGQDTKV